MSQPMSPDQLVKVNPWRPRSNWYYFKEFMGRISGFIEFLLLLAAWTFLFLNRQQWHGFNIKEIIAYILIGNFIGLIFGQFLQKMINRATQDGLSVLLLYTPVIYLIKLLGSNILKIVGIFAVSLGLQLGVMYFFFADFTLNFNYYDLSLIGGIIVLAFVVELLFAYLFRLAVFWTFESEGVYNLILRLKKLFAGAYVPLNFFPLPLLSASYFLPFAYSFYVPTQLYLKKVDAEVGTRGILVELIWIFILYGIIHLVWLRRNRQKAG